MPSVFPYPLELPKAVETDVAFQLDAKYFINDRGREIDFLAGDRLDCAVEVKIRNRIDSSDVKYLLKSGFKRKIVVVKPSSKLGISGLETATPMQICSLSLS